MRTHLGADMSVSGAVRRYIHNANITNFVTVLGTEPEANRRAAVMKLLVKEEDEFGFSYEQLSDAERRIAVGQRVIDNQRKLIARMSDSGQDIKEAKLLLTRLMQVQALFEAYRQKIKDRLEQWMIL